MMFGWFSRVQAWISRTKRGTAVPEVISELGSTLIATGRSSGCWVAR